MSKSTRRDFLREMTALGVGAAGAGGLACERADARRTPTVDPKRPNIVLILADDMGYSDIGCYGGEVRTPNLNRMAGGGLRFSQFYNTARCCPTRASLLTGLHPHQAGVGHMTWGLGPEHPGYEGDLNDRCVTIAEVLKSVGYRTACVGKWHVNAPGSRRSLPLQRGFQRYWGGAGRYFFPRIQDGEGPVQITNPKFILTDGISNKTVEFMDEFRKKGDEPFFIHVAYSAPHWPLQALPEDITKYRETFRKGWDGIRRERYDRMVAMSLVERRWPLSPRDGGAAAWAEAQNKEWEIERMAVYAAQIDRMDQGIGRIWQKVKDMGEEDNTLFLFLSDNGGCAEPLSPMMANFRIFPKTTPDGRQIRYGNDPAVMPGPADTFQSYGLAWANASNTPYRLYKHWIHEGGIATPLIAYCPGFVRANNEITHQPGHIIDIMATCVEVSGAVYPGTYNGHDITPLEGKSLSPIFRGGRRQGHSEIYWEHEGNKAVRESNLKLVSRYPNQWELYDLERDRTELHDLSARYPGKVAELSKLFGRWGDRVGVEPWGELAPLVEESFRDFMKLGPNRQETIKQN